MDTEAAPSEALEALVLAPSPPNNAEALPIITQLVPVIWELITRYMTGADVISICSILSKPMWLRFRYGVLGEFSIRPTDCAPHSPALYSFLRYLPRLVSIDLNNSTLRLWRAGPRVLELFPPTIRSVSLNIPFEFGIWLVIPRSKPLAELGTTKVIQGKSRSAGTKGILLTLAPSFYLQERLPCLEVLRIRDSGKVVTSQGIYFDKAPYEPAMKMAKRNFLKGLPPSLRMLSLPSLRCESDTLISHLPDFVQDVEFIVDGSLSSSKLKFPSNLLRLAVTIESYRPQELCTKLLSKLPSSLEALEWTQRSHADCTMFSYLTSHPLKALKLHYSNYPEPINTLFPLFPPTLTSLELDGREPDNDSFANLPRSLLSFKWTTTGRYRYGYHSMRYYDWANLPSHLEALELSDKFLITDIDYKLLPRTLTRLHLSITPHYWPNHDCDAPCGILCRGIRSNPRSPRCADAPSDLIALDLPPKLISLRLNNTYFGPQFFQNLPLSLEVLTIDSRAILDETTLCQLPPKLRTLNIDRAPNLDPAAFDLMVADELLELNLRVDSLRGASFTKLPRSLTRLFIENQKIYLDGHIKDLPRGLLHFYSPSTDTLTTRCAADLPRGLLTLRVAKITLQDPRPTRMQLLLDFPPVVPAFELHFVSGKGRRVLLENVP